MGDSVTDQTASKIKPSRSKPRRSLGRSLALVLVPIMVLSVSIIAGAIYLRTRTLVRDVSFSEITSLSNSEVRIIKSWSTERNTALFQMVNTPLREAIANQLTAPTLLTKDRVRSILTEIKSKQDPNLFSEYLILSTAEDTVTVLASTESSWEDILPPALINLSATEASNYLLIDDPVLAPGGMVFISAVPIRGTGSIRPNSLFVGISRDIAVSTLIQTLQKSIIQSASMRINANHIYLVFAPDMLIPLSGPAMEPDILVSSDHEVFSRALVSNKSTFDSFTLTGLPSLSSYTWIPEWDMGVLVELPMDIAMASIHDLGPFILILVAIMATVTTIIVLFSTTRILRPLTAMVSFAERLARGEWHHRVDENRTDELGLLAHSFNRMAADLEQVYRSMETEVEERTREIRIASEIAHAVTLSPSLENLLLQAVELIADRFQYDHVAIFLLDDEGKFAILREANDPAGKTMIADDFRIEVSPSSIIGWVSSQNSPWLSEDVTQDVMYQAHELLPDTRSEAALPLRFGDRTLGVLDIQSTETETLTPEKLEILQTLANELSTAIYNATLLESSSATAARARLITDLTGKLTGLLELEDVLETTAQSIYDTFGQPQVVVQLVSPEEAGYSTSSQADPLNISETMQSNSPEGFEE